VRDVVPAVPGPGEEGVVLGVAQVCAGVLGAQLDRHQGHPAADVVDGDGVAEDDALVRDDVPEGGAVLEVLLGAGRLEEAARELVAADAEVQLVAGVLRRARDAEPAPALRGIGVRGVDPGGRRGEVERQRERAVDDAAVSREVGSREVGSREVGSRDRGDLCERLGRRIRIHRSSMPATAAPVMPA
jgi:hypothetical protein